MITTSSTVRALSAKLALKVLQPEDNQQSNLDETSSSSKTVGRNVSHASATKVSADFSLLTVKNGSPYVGAAGVSSAYNETLTQVTSQDVDSQSFKDKLGSALQNVFKNFPDNTANNQTIAALKSGTLSIVAPPIESQNITFEDKAGDYMGNGNVLDGDAWDSFLSANLQTNSDGSFATSAPGVYIDKASGQNAGWAQIDSSLYYLTWPNSDVADAKA